MKTADISVELIDSMGGDRAVVNAARVSFHKERSWEDYLDEGGNYRIPESDIRLINYLARNNHWSPFGHVQATLRIKAPLFVARQLVKHQVGLCWNEVSRRYVDSEPEFWFPETWRGRAASKKQGSDGALEMSAQGWADTEAQEATLGCLNAYEHLLSIGVAPEQARIVLPQNMMTTWIWTGSLAAFARVVKLRLDTHAQEECQEVARGIDLLLREIAPHSWKALTNGDVA